MPNEKCAKHEPEKETACASCARPPERWQTFVRFCVLSQAEEAFAACIPSLWKIGENPRTKVQSFE